MRKLMLLLVLLVTVAAGPSGQAPKPLQTPVKIEAMQLERVDGKIVAVGKVKIVLNGYEIHAERAEILAAK